MNLTKMQKDLEMSNYFIIKYNLGAQDFSDIDFESIEFRMPN